MLKTRFCIVLEAELKRLGCPPGESRRLLRETDDHSADLRAEGSVLGVAPEELESWVERRLGQPAEIAVQMVESIRRRSWSSRHPALAFCVLPIFSYLGLAVLLVFACLPALDSDVSRSWIAAHPAVATSVLQGILLTLGAVIVVSLTRRAFRCVHGGRWAMAVAASSMISLPMTHLELSPFSLILGWGLWSCASVPAVLLLCAGTALREMKKGQRQVMRVK
jgi:hypothetical protein